MTKYTLKQEYPGGFSHPKETVTVEFEGDLTLDMMLEKFEFFLKGCGFFFDGHLQFVEEVFPDWTGQDEDEPQHSEFYFDTDRNIPVR